MNVFVENDKGSRKRIRYDERTFEFKESFDVDYAYPYAYGFITNTNKHQEDCIDCYIITNRPLPSGAVVDCEPLGMIEMHEDAEIDHKVLMGFRDEPAGDLNDISTEIKTFIRNIFKKFKEVHITFGRLVSKEETLAFIRNQFESE